MNMQAKIFDKSVVYATMNSIVAQLEELIPQQGSPRDFVFDVASKNPDILATRIETLQQARLDLADAQVELGLNIGIGALRQNLWEDVEVYKFAIEQTEKILRDVKKNMPHIVPLTIGIPSQTNSGTEAYQANLSAVLALEANYLKQHGQGRFIPAGTIYELTDKTTGKTTLLSLQQGIVSRPAYPGESTDEVVLEVMGKQLGKGQHGEVYESQIAVSTQSETGNLSIKPSNQKIKLLHFDTENKNQQMAYGDQEGWLSDAQHEANILKIAEQGQASISEVTPINGMPYLAITSEKAEGETIHSLIESGQLAALPLTERLAAAAQFLQKVNELHTASTPIVHRDIHTKNLFLDTEQDAQGALKVKTIKLTDYGLARELSDNLDNLRRPNILNAPAFLTIQQGGGVSSDNFNSLVVAAQIIAGNDLPLAPRHALENDAEVLKHGEGFKNAKTLLTAIDLEPVRAAIVGLPAAQQDMVMANFNLLMAGYKEDYDFSDKRWKNVAQQFEQLDLSASAQQLATIAHNISQPSETYDLVIDNALSNDHINPDNPEQAIQRDYLKQILQQEIARMRQQPDHKDGWIIEAGTHYYVNNTEGDIVKLTLQTPLFSRFSHRHDGDIRFGTLDGEYLAQGKFGAVRTVPLDIKLSSTDELMVKSSNRVYKTLINPTQEGVDELLNEKASFKEYDAKLAAREQGAAPHSGRVSIAQQQMPGGKFNTVLIMPNLAPEKGMNFKEYIKKGLLVNADDMTRLHLAQDFIEILRALGDAGYVHGDLHPGNLLLSRQAAVTNEQTAAGDNNRLRARVADFGTALKIDSTVKRTKVNDSYMPPNLGPDDPEINKTSFDSFMMGTSLGLVFTKATGNILLADNQTSLLQPRNVAQEKGRDFLWQQYFAGEQLLNLDLLFNYEGSHLSTDDKQALIDLIKTLVSPEETVRASVNLEQASQLLQNLISKYQLQTQVEQQSAETKPAEATVETVPALQIAPAEVLPPPIQQQPQSRFVPVGDADHYSSLQEQTSNDVANIVEANVSAPSNQATEPAIPRADMTTGKYQFGVMPSSSSKGIDHYAQIPAPVSKDNEVIKARSASAPVTVSHSTVSSWDKAAEQSKAGKNTTPSGYGAMPITSKPVTSSPAPSPKSRANHAPPTLKSTSNYGKIPQGNNVPKKTANDYGLMPATNSETSSRTSRASTAPPTLKGTSDYGKIPNVTKKTASDYGLMPAATVSKPDTNLETTSSQARASTAPPTLKSTGGYGPISLTQLNNSEDKTKLGSDKLRTASLPESLQATAQATPAKFTSAWNRDRASTEAKTSSADPNKPSDYAKIPAIEALKAAQQKNSNNATTQTLTPTEVTANTTQTKTHDGYGQIPLQATTNQQDQQTESRQRSTVNPASPPPSPADLTPLERAWNWITGIIPGKEKAEITTQNSDVHSYDSDRNPVLERINNNNDVDLGKHTSAGAGENSHAQMFKGLSVIISSHRAEDYQKLKENINQQHVASSKEQQQQEITQAFGKGGQSGVPPTASLSEILSATINPVTGTRVPDKNNKQTTQNDEIVENTAPHP
ncbi:MAG: hypothetical protein Tsb005_00830 [Gammaproteobacteria bacterium]